MRNTKLRLYAVFLVLCLLGITWRLLVGHATKHSEIKIPTPISSTISSSEQKSDVGVEFSPTHQSDDIANRILALLNSGDPKDQDKAYQLLKDWVRRDPHAAADFAQSALV